MAGYVRNDTTDNIATGNTIRAADLDGEYDAVEAAFNAVTGHTHDGTAAEGGPITVTGPAQDIVSSSSALRPKTDDTYDLGTAVYQWKDLYIDGTAYIDALETDSLTVLGGGIDNTPIGQTIPAAGTFTTLDATSVVFDGGSADNLVIGAATPADATFVDVQVDGNLIVDGGVDISPSAHVLPTTTNVYDLGSAVYEFRNLYIDGIAYLDRVESGEAVLTGGTGENMIFDATNTYSGTLLNATVTSLTSPLAIQYGGTSAGNVADARTNLGLGSMAIQNSNGVNITGGSLSGVSVSGYATQTWVQTQGYITSSALTGYATESWVTTRGYITSSALAGYATETWVSNRGYATSASLGSMAYQNSGSVSITGGTVGGISVGSLASESYVDTAVAGVSVTDVDYISAGNTSSGAPSRYSAYSGWFLPTTGNEEANVRIQAAQGGARLWFHKNQAYSASDTSDHAIYFGTTTDNDHGAIRYEFDNDRMVLRGSADDQLYIDSTGVGINTSVAYTLDVGGSARVDSSLTAGTLYSTGSTIAGDTISSMTSSTGYGCRILPGGYVFVQRNNNPCLYLGIRETTLSINSPNDIARFYLNNTEYGAIQVTGSTCAIVFTSDYRLKEDVQPITDSWERVKNLKPSTYTLKENPHERVEGFIAHELQEIVPQAATGQRDQVDEEGNPVYQKINPVALIPVLTAALKDALTRVEKLEWEMEEIKNGST